MVGGEGLWSRMFFFSPETRAIFLSMDFLSVYMGTLPSLFVFSLSLPFFRECVHIQFETTECESTCTDSRIVVKGLSLSFSIASSFLITSASSHTRWWGCSIPFPWATYLEKINYKPISQILWNNNLTYNTHEIKYTYELTWREEKQARSCK